jgi:hypothetical protein
MHLHLRIHRWVLWWFWIGVVLGAIAVVNILLRNLTRWQETIILVVGALNWLIGGIICWGYGAVRIERPDKSARGGDSALRSRQEFQQKEWHAASDFVLPGNRKSLLPPKY